MKNSQLENESRIIFDYSRIYKDLLECYLKLFFRVYNNLLNLRHKYLFIIDLKYTYLTISLYKNNRYYFAFIIVEIN